MRHRKREHIESRCRDYPNGCCRFETDKCWFQHKDTNEKQVEESSKMIIRIFEMKIEN